MRILKAYYGSCKGRLTNVAAFSWPSTRMTKLARMGQGQDCLRAASEDQTNTHAQFTHPVHTPKAYTPNLCIGVGYIGVRCMGIRCMGIRCIGIRCMGVWVLGVSPCMSGY